LSASDLMQIRNPEKLRDNKMNRIAYLTKKVQQKIQHILFADSSEFIQIINRRPVLARPAKIGFYLDNPSFYSIWVISFFLNLLSGLLKTILILASDLRRRCWSIS